MSTGTYKIVFTDDNKNIRLNTAGSPVKNGSAITTNATNIIVPDSIFKKIQNSITGFFKGLFGGFSWIGSNWQLLMIGVIALLILNKR